MKTIGLILLIATSAQAQQLSLSQPLPTDPAVTIGRLPNGLTYYIRVNQKPEDRAELRLVVNAGSLLEDPKQLGIAHFVEHMAFNGTRNFPKQELVSFLESIGMRFGADVNAWTSFDETVYMLTLPTDTGLALAKGFQILEDWAHNQLFDAGEIEKERGVVIEEWRLGQGAEERMRDKYFPVLFRTSRYAERLPIGTKTSLEGFRHEDLVRFYRDWYRPELMAVIAVGDFDKARVEQLIRQHFGSLRATSSSQPRTVFPVPDHDSTLVAIATDKEATSAQVSVYYKQPVSQASTVGDYRQLLLAQLFSHMLNGRLRELAQLADPPFVGATAGQGKLIRSKEVFVLSAGVEDDGVLRGLDALATEAERLRRFGFTATELERARQNLLRALEQAYAERDKTESDEYANEYVRGFLEAEPIPGINVEYELAKKLLPAVQLADVNALAQQWIVDSNRVVVVEAPEKSTVQVPDRAQLLVVFDSVRNRQLLTYVDRVANAPLIAALPTNGRIVSERKDTLANVMEWRLSNGVRVLLKPTDFQADEVVVRAYSPGGLSMAENADYVSALFSSALVALSGAGAFDAVQLTKALAGKAVRVSPYIDDRQEGFMGAASPRDLETLFQLVHLYATAPRRDSTAFQSLKTRMAAVLENQGASPESALRDTLEVTLAQHHFRARPLTRELLNEIDMQRALAFYANRFRDLSDFTFVLVGSFSPDSVRPLVERYLASLPAVQRKEQSIDRGVRPPTGVIQKEVRKGVEPKSRTQIVFTGPFDFTVENRLAISVLADVLDMRLRDVLREDMGGTYGVSVSQSVQREPTAMFSLAIGFDADPARLEELTRVVFQQLDNLKRLGPTAEEVAKVKETQRREWETNLKRNVYWAAQIAARDAIGERPADVLTFPQRLARANQTMVRDAARRYLPADNYVRVSLYPQ